MQNFAIWFDGAMDITKGFIRSAIEPLGFFLNIFSDFRTGAILIPTVFAVFLIICMRYSGGNFRPVLKRPQNVAICAMLIAINVILGYFSISFSSYLRVGFGFITAPVAAFLFGPFIGGAVALLSDIISFIIKPTGAFLFTYTLNTGIAGMIYGLFLYKKDLTFVRVFFCKLTVILAVNIILNSIALAPTAANGLVGIFPARLIKKIILLPIQSLVVFEVLKIAVKGRIANA